VVQGWRVTDEPENIVEIPEFLLGYLLPGTSLDATLYATGKRWSGDDGECDTYILSGQPVTDAAALNIEAGEDIRWLPRNLLDGLDVTADDFWLIDRKRVVFTVFTPDGTFSGGAETVDPVIVDRCNTVRDTLWSIAVSHVDYAES
jgi:hypothetical protein